MADAAIGTGSANSVPERLDPEAVARLSDELPNWLVDGERLVRTVAFEGYLAVLAFLGRLAPVAEQLSHHPDVVWRYDRLEIAITTHDVGGLTPLDAELARHIDRLLDP